MNITLDREESTDFDRPIQIHLAKTPRAEGEFATRMAPRSMEKVMTHSEQR